MSIFAHAACENATKNRHFGDFWVIEASLRSKLAQKRQKCNFLQKNCIFKKKFAKRIFTKKPKMP